MITIQNLIDDKKCFEVIREIRWPDGVVVCVNCGSIKVSKRGKDETQSNRQRYHCKSCYRDFDDLTGTIFSNHHQPLKTWVMCLYFMGLNLSGNQIAKELDLNKDDVQKMTQQLREGVEERRSNVQLSGQVECDEVYIVAGHKGNSCNVKKKSKRTEKSFERVSR